MHCTLNARSKVELLTLNMSFINSRLLTAMWWIGKCLRYIRYFPVRDRLQTKHCTKYREAWNSHYCPDLSILGLNLHRLGFESQKGIRSFCGNLLNVFYYTWSLLWFWKKIMDLKTNWLCVHVAVKSAVLVLLLIDMLIKTFW